MARSSVRPDNRLADITVILVVGQPTHVSPD